MKRSFLNRSPSLITALALLAGGLSPSSHAILNGKSITPGEFAEVFAIKETDSNSREAQVCSGVLVAPNLILTAGHCAEHDAKDIRLATNVSDLNAWEKPTYGQPLKWAAHPNYKVPEKEPTSVIGLARAATWDIGYVVLKTELSLNSALVASYSDNQAALNQLMNQSVELAGYGDNRDRGRESTFWKHGTKRFGNKVVKAVLYDSLIFEGNENVGLPGDSGGPIYYIENGQKKVVALVSRFGRDVDGKIYLSAASVLRKDTLCWVQADSGIAIPGLDCDGWQPPKPRD